MSVDFQDRREKVFLLIAGLFLGSLAILNVLGVTKFIDMSFMIGEMKVPFSFPVGVLPYPITFLCTDLISELYGRKKANQVVWVGLVLNVWVLIILYVGDALPGAGPSPTFDDIKGIATSGVWGSMLAYLLAQFIDVSLFHKLKEVTKGKMLWLRNNGSTLVSQLVDTIVVLAVLHYTDKPFNSYPEYSPFTNLWIIIGSAYVFKAAAALLDTLPFYFLTKWLTKYLGLEEPANT